MLLKMHAIEKSFFDSRILKNMHFELERGQVHALIGPNGAGKSTLIKILSGVFPPDSGEILIDDKIVSINSPSEAIDLGIFTLYQETHLIPTMTIYDNLFLGMPYKKHGVFVDYKKIKKKTREILDIFNCHIPVQTKVSELSHGEKYVVSIARAFLREAQIYILDEPTASISGAEQKILFDLIRSLKEQNVGIIYITHRVNEVKAICDKVTIIKDGHNVYEQNLSNISTKELIHIATSGMEQQEITPNEIIYEDSPTLEVRNLTLEPIYSDINFKLYKGEILGFAGAMGSGKSAILKTIFGAIHQDKGEIIIGGRTVEFPHPRDAVKAGVGYLPDDRIDSSIIPNMNVLENSILSSFTSNEEPVFLNKDWEIEVVLDKVFELNMDLKDLDRSIQILSGGNQQKVLFARWMLANTDILLLDEPTKGIDIATRNDLHYTILEKAASGSSIIVSSSDITELLALCNRIVVINHGRIVDIMYNESATEQRLIDAIDL